MSPRQSAAVYRRRRLVVLIALVVVIALLVTGVWFLVSKIAGASEDPAAAPSTSAPAPAESGDPEPSVTPTPGGTPVACGKGDVEVSALTDKESYGTDEKPKFSISLKNTSKNDCTINVGSSQQVFTVSSGDDTWWRSTDCQTKPSDMVVTLSAGQEVESAEPVEWDRSRSDADTCEDKNRPMAPGGDASYHLAVKIGGFEAAETRQFILK